MSFCNVENERTRRRALYKRVGGFTMVELLVGLTIGLIGMLVIYKVLGAAEGYRKTSSVTSMAQESGAVGMFQLERDLRQAGYGLNGILWETVDAGSAKAAGDIYLGRVFGCVALANDAATHRTNFPVQLAPVLIAQGGVNALGGAMSDTVSVLYGNPRMYAFPPGLTHALAPGGGPFYLANGFSLAVGDVIALVDATTPSPNCEISQVGDVEPENTTTPVVCPPNAVNIWCVNVNSPSTATFNFARPFQKSYPGSGTSTPDILSNSAMVLDLGASPTAHTYSVGPGPNSPLNMTDSFFPDRSGDMADNVYSLQAQYMFDNGEIHDSIPAGMTWYDVRGVRVAVVTRGDLYEKTMITDPTLVVFAGSGTAVDGVSLKFTDQERHYRYRTFVSVVPLRNINWNP